MLIKQNHVSPGVGQPCPVSSPTPGCPWGNQLLLTSSSLWAIIFPVPCSELLQVPEKSSKCKAGNKAAKKKPGITWLVAFIRHYFAHVEGFMIALKGLSMVTAWQHQLVAQPEQIGAGEVLRDAHQLFTPPFTQPTSNKHLLCAGAGLGAEHPTANNTHLTLWWTSQEING